jgi:hypothetical protein
MPSEDPSAKASSRRPVVRFASASPARDVGATRRLSGASVDPPSASAATTTSVTFGDPMGSTTPPSLASSVGPRSVDSKPFVRLLNA